MIRRELAIFLVVGFLTVVVDFSTYRRLLSIAGLSTEAAKAAGFLTGTVFAYFVNRHWTFGRSEPVRGSYWRFAILYAATLGANVLVNEWLLQSLAAVDSILQVAFLVATGISAFLNFMGMKWFVFKPQATSEPT